MEHDRLLPFKSFFYTDRDKQAYVQAEMERLHISYRQTENGFEAQECHVQAIREIEQSYQPKPRSARDKLRADIDRFVPLSQDIFYLMAHLVKAGYDIKYGKYLAFRAKDAKIFIRLKSLGVEYSEIALKGRIKANREFEQRLEEQLAEAPEKRTGASHDAIIYRCCERRQTHAAQENSGESICVDK